MTGTDEREHHAATERTSGSDTEERHGGERFEARMGQAAERTHRIHDKTARPAEQAAGRPAASEPPPRLSYRIGGAGSEKCETDNGTRDGTDGDADDASKQPETIEMEPR